MRTPLLWCATHALCQPAGQPLSGPVQIPAEGARSRAHTPGTLVLVPVDAPGGAGGRLSALLLVPDALAGRVRIDRARSGAGMHPLRHGARIDFEARELWVSMSCSGTEEPYGPEHGPDRHCFRVKAKLKAGEPVVVCPGVPRAACGVLYKAAAWRTVRVCANCGHEPGAPAWTPPTGTALERRSLHALFARARSRRA